MVILFGLSTLGVLKIPWLAMDTRPQWQGTGRKGLAASGMMGMFFAAGWTPCIGTTLGAILAGLLSFFSPCVLPLVPAYMGYLSGHAVGPYKFAQLP